MDFSENLFLKRCMLLLLFGMAELCLLHDVWFLHIHGVLLGRLRVLRRPSIFTPDVLKSLPISIRLFMYADEWFQRHV